MSPMTDTVSLWVQRALVWSVVCFVALSFQPAHASKTNTSVIELEPGKQVTVEVELNGVKAPAVIDTAATLPLINHDYIASSDIKWREADQLEILGIGGTRRYPTAELNSLSIGAESWIELPVAVNTVNRMPVQNSILPISLFNQRVIDFDFTNNELQLYDGPPKRVRRGEKSTVAYSYTERLMFIDVEINGVKAKALIDTGANVSFVNPAFMRAADGKLDIEETLRVRGSDLSNQWASVFQFRQFRIGTYKVRKPRFVVLKTDLFEKLGMGDQPMMILGMDVLKHWRLQVDREQQQITFVLQRPNKRAETRYGSGTHLTAGQQY